MKVGSSGSELLSPLNHAQRLVVGEVFLPNKLASVRSESKTQDVFSM